MPPAAALLGSTFRGEGAIRLADVRSDPRYGQDAPYRGIPSGHPQHVASYLAVPVVSRSAEVLGTLLFAQPDVGVFGEREERIVVGLAAQAAIAMDNARFYEAERTARAEAEAANRAKDEFLAMLGHELRNPIGAISNSIRVLAGGGIADEQAEALFAIVGRQTSTLSRLVDDLLDVSRLTSGKIVLKREAVNLAEIAERCVALFRAAGRVSHHAITLEAEAAWVDGDATRLEQVVGNLLENAVKYTAVGGRIAVRVLAEDERVVLRMADTGRGIDAEMIPRIFDVFTQGQQSLDRAQGGLGIGLALVKRLVELHGGEVSAASEGPGRGSEFIVRLPRGHEETRRERVAAPILPRRILVVEDHADAREALRLLLKKEGHVVEVAASGPEGVEKALALRPEVAIVDIGLPGLNGYEVAKRIRSAEGGKDIHLVALTGYGQQEDRRRAREAEFDAHLVKPLDPAELRRILARVAPAQTAPVSTAEVVAPVRRSAGSGA
jgi:signal transduction histidine kinase/ActR/RegA family two-component response regulator